MGKAIAAWLALVLAACTNNTYIVQGTVVEVESPTRVVIDHDEIPGYMGPMTMPFEVRDASAIGTLKPGDQLFARLVVEEKAIYLDTVRVTGHGDVPKVKRSVEPVRPTLRFPRTEIAEATGTGPLLVGEGQSQPTLLTFLFTTCPNPEFCPLLVQRLQPLQEKIEGKARIVAITLDPATDTVPVLQAFAERSSVDPAVWRFGRVDTTRLGELAMLAGLPVHEADGEIRHGTRLLILDAAGKLIERYDDNQWPADRVVQQLLTGGPAAPVGSSGTLSAPVDEKAGRGG